MAWTNDNEGLEMSASLHEEASSVGLKIFGICRRSKSRFIGIS